MMLDPLKTQYKFPFRKKIFQSVLSNRIYVILLFAVIFLPPFQLFSQNFSNGRVLFLKGEYEKAVAALDVRRHTPESLVWLTYAIAETGDLVKAKEVITQRRGWQNYLPLVNRIGELEFALSNYQQAKRFFEQAFAMDSTYLEARLNLGEVQAQWGNRKRARQLLQYFVDLYKITPYPDARLSFTTAQACIYLNRFRDANDLFQDASRQMPDDWRVFVRWGNLFLDKYNFSDALATFNDALKLNPNAVEAKIGIARSNEQSEPQKNPEIIKSLLDNHPDRIDVLNYAAHWYLETGDKDEAEKHIKKALKIAPQNLSALTLNAKLHLLRKDKKTFDRIAKKVLEINPGYSAVYTEAGDLLSRRYLFEEAVVEYRRALEIDSEDAAALAGLGTTLSRLANLDEAKPTLEKAFKLDPYNVWTKNLLDLFDSYKDYETIQTDHFNIRLHKDDAKVVGIYAADLAEKAYEAMVSRYRVTLDFPVTIEIFPQHDDFAVRSFGLPGAQAFLGICFGPLITMNSPRARTIGTFNWQETLWHEFAHVVHLTLTKNRLPRWLAEGIAVYEATTANPAWDMNFHIAMIKALERDKIIPLKELDSGFVGDPTRVTFSYYQSSQMVTFIVEKHGFSKLLDLLVAFREGKNTAGAVKSILGLDTEEFDTAFKQFLNDRFVKEGVDFSWENKKLPKEPVARIEKLRKITSRKPNNYFGSLYLGNTLLSTKAYSEAIPILEKAHSLFPQDVSGDSPYAGLTLAYLATKDTVKAVKMLGSWLDRNAKNYRASLQLYELASEIGKTNLAIKGLETAIQISPYNSDVHKQLGELYMLNNDAERAVREFRVELALNPTDKAGAHCRLAGALLLANNKAEAKNTPCSRSRSRRRMPKHRKFYSMLFNSDFSRSNGLRWNAVFDAPRRVVAQISSVIKRKVSVCWTQEHPEQHSHAERGNEISQNWGGVQKSSFLSFVFFLVPNLRIRGNLRRETHEIPPFEGGMSRAVSVYKQHPFTSHWPPSKGEFALVPKLQFGNKSVQNDSTSRQGHYTPLEGDVLSLSKGGQGGVTRDATIRNLFTSKQATLRRIVTFFFILFLLPFSLNGQNFSGKNSTDHELDVFQFIRIKHESSRIPAFAFYSFFQNGMEPWAHDYPTAEYNLYDMLERFTIIDVTHKPKILTLDDDEIFNYPVLYICEIGYWNLREPLAKRLGEYLNRGGFLIIDDFRLPNEMDNLRRQLRKAVPNYTEKILDSSHPIFNCFYEFPALPIDSPYSRGYGLPVYYGLFDENGRLAAIINYNNDIGDGWELATSPNFRVESFKLGINYFIYSMTH
jgi:tetratricopeptide (TPR) repeat protein